MYSERSWQDKLREWNFKKHIPDNAMQFVVAKEEERAREGKDTVFRYGGFEITHQRIQNFKSRKSRAVAFLPNPGESSMHLFLIYL
jgi:hypothetical protein